MKHIIAHLAVTALIATPLLSVTGAAPAGDAAPSPATNITATVEAVLTPFWKTDTMRGESLFFGQTNVGQQVSATLLFPPEKILSVTSATGTNVYEEGKDYVIDKVTGVMTLPEGSRIPWKTYDEMCPVVVSPKTDASQTTGEPKRRRIQGAVFHGMQIEVTYTHRGKWEGRVPAFAGDILPNTMKKLRAREPITLCISGDSISQGYDSSGFAKKPPHMPPFADLVALGIEKAWGSKVTLRNFARGGWTSSSGLANVASVAAAKPDLVIIAYGMNGRGGPLGSDVAGMMEKIKSESPTAEFILVARMLPYDESFRRDEVFVSRIIYSQRNILEKLCGPGIALADVTSVWFDMLGRKGFYDLTGNGINHPNDFGHRVYAQVILSLLIEERGVK